MYNPNKMAPPEFALLKVSIKQDGWLFPILVLSKIDNEDKYTIVDGFHRWKVSGEPEIYPITNGFVPVLVLDPPNRKATTVRMNRIKGTHAVLSMAEIIQSEIEAGVSVDEICELYGMEDEEVERLAARVGLPLQILEKAKGFNKSWIPSSK